MKTTILILSILALIAIPSSGQASGQNCRVSVEQNGSQTIYREYCVAPDAERGPCHLEYILSAPSPTGQSTMLYHYNCSLYRLFLPDILH